MEILDWRDKFNGKMLNTGSQTDAFLCESDIVIYIGNRGVGKSHLILSKSLPHIGDSNYRAAYFRKMVKDSQTVGGLADNSRKLFGQFGKYLESVQLMTWKFDSGARIVFANYSASESEFADSIQGVEYYYAFIDEITQISEERFNAIYSNLRNTTGKKTQIFGTANADPNSWIKRLINWWIDPETGFHIPERNGVERYFYQWGDDITESHWGDTKEEVYEQSKAFIDEMWDSNMAKYGTKLDLIQSITVFEGKMSENKHLMKSGGVKYYGKLLKGSNEMKGRYARACWKKIDLGDSLVSNELLERFFNNSFQTNGTKYASLDVAGSGENADKVVMWIWDGYHITNIYATSGLNPKELLEWTQRILSREGVKNENFVYDGVGVGWIFEGFFNGAVKFMSQASASDDSKVEFDRKKLSVYKNAKAEVVGRFLEEMKNHNNTGECGVSIDPDVLRKILFGKTVRQHLEEEKIAIRWRDDRDGIKQMIDKKETKRLLGHSPDFIFSLIYRFAISEKNVKMSEEKINELINFLSF